MTLPQESADATAPPAVTGETARRLFDASAAALGLLVLSPVLLVVAVSVAASSPGPVFFRQVRVGKGGRPFNILKFRTMRKNAEQMKEELAAMNQADGPQFFIEDDPRILKVGKILRKTQLDEFPQFINVLLGHMSVVGPRPSPDKENQYCPAWREARRRARS